MDRRRSYVEQGDQLVVPCHHCQERQHLQAERAEVTEGRAWYRCEHCDQWFLIRWDDAVELGVARAITST